MKSYRKTLENGTHTYELQNTLYDAVNCTSELHFKNPKTKEFVEKLKLESYYCFDYNKSIPATQGNSDLEFY